MRTTGKVDVFRGRLRNAMQQLFIWRDVPYFSKVVQVVLSSVLAACWISLDKFTSPICASCECVPEHHFLLKGSREHVVESG